MAFFKKKKAVETAQNDEQKNMSLEASQVDVSDTAKQSKKKKKRKDGMASILHESVWETIVGELEANQAFITQRDGEKLYVGLLLNANDIGGISKKSNKDEAKGSIIECINSGRIKTLVSTVLMESESLVFIPDAITIDAMDEYGLLVEAPYKLCYIDCQGNVEPTDVSVTFNQIKDIIINDETVGVLLGTDNVEDEIQEVEYDPDEDYTVDMDDETEAESMGSNEMPFGSDESANNESEYIEEQEFEDEIPSDDYSDDYDESDEEPDDYEDYQEMDEAESELPDEIPDEIVNEAIVRKFYSDDLGLEVSTDPFDSQFLHNNAYIPFNEDRGEGWLNQYLNQMAKDANIEMRRMRQDNLFRMRERYFTLISMHCEEIYKKLDTSDATTQYGKMYEALKRQKVDATSQIDRMVSDKKVELEKAWEEKLAQVAEDAARAAKQQYRERFGRQHDDDMYHILPDIKDSIENEFQDALRDMHNSRRAEASKLLDYGINETLKEISDMYIQLLDEEQARYKELQADMNAFLDNNRKDEIARANALAEELSQTQKADIVMAEQTEKIKNLSADFDAKRSELLSEIETIQRKNEQTIKEKEDAHNNRIAEMQRRNDELQGQLDKLLERFANLDEVKNKEFASRINELSNEKAAMEDKCNHVINVHKRSNTISGFLVAAAVVASLAIGFIAGEFVYINKDKQATQSAIITEFNSLMENIGDDASTEVTPSAPQE